MMHEPYGPHEARHLALRLGWTGIELPPQFPPVEISPEMHDRLDAIHLDRVMRLAASLGVHHEADAAMADLMRRNAPQGRGRVLKRTR